MPIRFNCKCGKQLQAKDNFGGRRMRCPACGEILTIPGASAPAVEPIALEPVEAPTLEPVAVAPILTPAADAEALTSVIPVDDETASVLPAEPPTVDPVEEPPAVPVIPVVPEFDASRPKPKPAIENVWSTVSLDQYSVPWPADEKNRIGAAEEKERGRGARLLILCVILILLAGLAGAYWFFGGAS